MKIPKPYRLILVAWLFAAPVYSNMPEDGRFPKDPKVAVNSELTGYFKAGYAESRADFLKRAGELAARFKGTRLNSVPVPTQTGKELFVDLFYIPAIKTHDKLLVISSGIHGVEGFAGSAVQRMVMDKFLTVDNLSNTGVLLIHAMNPYGFSEIRRVTENNVDMNRNSSMSPDLFGIDNEGYSKLYDFINPAKPVSLGSCQNRLFVARAILKILKATMPVLRQAVLQGQYQYPEGLYFGGKDFEPQLSVVKPVMSGYAAGYNSIIHIDLHTGYGGRGKMHLFPNPAKSPEMKDATEKLYEGYHIDWGDSKDFYTVTGDFTSLLGQMYPDKPFIPMTLEYGTMDSQKTMGSLRSIQNMILENQGFHHGYKSKRSERKVKEWFREMYAPSSPVWRTMVMEQSVELMGKVFGRR
jgi:hypothetical protein